MLDFVRKEDNRMKKEKEKRMEKPKYSMTQNLRFLTKMAWKLEKETVYIPIVKEMFDLVVKLLELFIVPVILHTVERRADIGELLLTIGVFTLALVVCTGLSHYFDVLHDRAEGRLRCHVVYCINEAVCTTSYPNTLDKKYQEKMQQAMRSADYSVASSQLYDDFIRMFGAVTGFAMYLLLMTSVSPWLIVIVLACSVGGYFLVPNTRRINVWSYGAEKDTAEYTHAMSYVNNTIMGNEMGKDIRLFGLGGWLQDIYDSAMRMYRNFIVRREKKYLVADLASILLTVLQNGLAYAYLIYITMQDNLTASEFLLMFTAISGFGGWINTMLYTAGEMHKKSLGLCHIRELFDWPEPFQLEGGKAIETAENNAYELRLENVTYAYPEAKTPTIDRMNLTIRPGEKLAIVGLNGAGKTTLVKLLCGFLDPQEGRVLLNGQDIRQFNRREYYRLFTAVFQEFSNLNATIAANVAQTEKQMEREKVEQCLKQAGLWEAVCALPQGMDTNFGKAMHDDGIELSGGQTQRLMLARALYKNAPILIMDEPTAALDPLAEHEMYQKYNDMSAGRTSLFISHRLASTRFCDRILFLENGRIAEEGSHEELLKKAGGYAELFEVQSRYYKEGDFSSESKGGLAWQE